MVNKKDSLGDRMKEYYEYAYRTYLTRRTPVIIRLDGVAFHTYLKGFYKPFDNIMVDTMREVTLELCRRIQGCVFGYTQSDEITLILNDYKTIDTEAWYDYNIQKVCSVSAALCTKLFNQFIEKKMDAFIKENVGTIDAPTAKLIAAYTCAKRQGAMFDSRCFNIPKEEAINCVLWRIKDCVKNSVSALARVHFSHKQLEGKNTEEKKQMLLEQHGIDWNKHLRECTKTGSCIVKTDEGWNMTDGAPTTYNELEELIGDNLNATE